MTHFRHAAIFVALLAGAGAAGAQTTIITREPVESRTVVVSEPLQLTPVQRQTIYRTIVRERVSPPRPTVGIPGWNARAGKRAALFDAARSCSRSTGHTFV